MASRGKPSGVCVDIKCGTQRNSGWSPEILQLGWTPYHRAARHWMDTSCYMLQSSGRVTCVIMCWPILVTCGYITIYYDILRYITISYDMWHVTLGFWFETWQFYQTVMSNDVVSWLNSLTVELRIPAAWTSNIFWLAWFFGTCVEHCLDSSCRMRHVTCSHSYFGGLK
jgi:hypothetical protein